MDIVKWKSSFKVLEMDSRKVDRDQATSFGQSGSLCFERGRPTERGGCEAQRESDERVEIRVAASR